MYVARSPRYYSVPRRCALADVGDHPVQIVFERPRRLITQCRARGADIGDGIPQLAGLRRRYAALAPGRDARSGAPPSWFSDVPRPVPRL